jgi:hypothetical protein
VEENIGAAAIDLTPDDLHAIDGAASKISIQGARYPEVLDALERPSIEGRHVMIETPCDRPEPVPLGDGEEVFAAS